MCAVPLKPPGGRLHSGSPRTSCGPWSSPHARCFAPPVRKPSGCWRAAPQPTSSPGFPPPCSGRRCWISGSLDRTYATRRACSLIRAPRCRIRWWLSHRRMAAAARGRWSLRWLRQVDFQGQVLKGGGYCRRWLRPASTQPHNVAGTRSILTLRGFHDLMQLIPEPRSLLLANRSYFGNNGISIHCQSPGVLEGADHRGPIPYPGLKGIVLFPSSAARRLGRLPAVAFHKTLLERGGLRANTAGDCLCKSELAKKVFGGE